MMVLCLMLKIKWRTKRCSHRGYSHYIKSKLWNNEITPFNPRTVILTPSCKTTNKTLGPEPSKQHTVPANICQCNTQYCEYDATQYDAISYRIARCNMLEKTQRAQQQYIPRSTRRRNARLIAVHITFCTCAAWFDFLIGRFHTFKIWLVHLIRPVIRQRHPETKRLHVQQHILKKTKKRYCV